MKKSKPSNRRPRTPAKESPTLPIPDRRGMEQMTADLMRLLQSKQFSSIAEVNAFMNEIQGSGIVPPPFETPLERAQEIMYEAWTASGRRRVKLAQEALAESPDCADAYVLLAEETVKTAEAARDLYAQGVAAGERALGADFFKQYAGHFWGLIETRPYMRAREGLAQTLFALGELPQAIAHFQEMLRLNPGDNQGIRYLLARSLLAQGADQALVKLLAEYSEDAMAEWLYTRALVEFRLHGQGAAANRALRKALKENPHVPRYLFGIEKLPSRPPESYGFGDKNEAILYVGNCGAAWRRTPGALAWFKDQFSDAGQRARRDGPSAVR